jgi:hypothetical protein
MFVRKKSVGGWEKLELLVRYLDMCFAFVNCLIEFGIAFRYNVGCVVATVIGVGVCFHVIFEA